MTIAGKPIAWNSSHYCRTQDTSWQALALCAHAPPPPPQNTARAPMPTHAHLQDKCALVPCTVVVYILIQQSVYIDQFICPAGGLRGATSSKARAGGGGEAMALVAVAVDSPVLHSQRVQYMRPVLSHNTMAAHEPLPHPRSPQPPHLRHHILSVRPGVVVFGVPGQRHFAQRQLTRRR